jgi:hypothetical protein
VAKKKSSPGVKRLSQALTASFEELSDSFPIKKPPPPPPPPLSTQKLETHMRRRADELLKVPGVNARTLKRLRSAVEDETFPPHKPPPPPPPPFTAAKVGKYLHTLANMLEKSRKAGRRKG